MVLVSRAPMAAIVEDPILVARAEEVVAAAADHLGLPPQEMTPTALAHQLEDLRRSLERRIALRFEPTDDWATTVELSISISRLRCELLDHDLSRRVKSMPEIRRALGGLSGLSPREMIYQAPVVVSRELAFARTMISAVRGSVWLPEHLHIEDERADRHSRAFLEYVEGRRIQLADAPLESEVVRKRRGALVSSAMDDKRTFKEMVEVAGCFSYIAVPLTARGRVIGMLHADRPEPHGVVAMPHLDQLEAFAECLSVTFESAVLAEKAARQRAGVDNLCADVDAVLSGSARGALWSLSGAPAGQRHDADRGDQPAVLALTARQQEVMSHVATGATNSQIAQSLVISEETVKSHLKHIAKKLNTSGRAAAVATYADMAS